MRSCAPLIVAYIAALDALFVKDLGEPPGQQGVLDEIRKRFAGK